MTQCHGVLAVVMHYESSKEAESAILDYELQEGGGSVLEDLVY